MRSRSRLWLAAGVLAATLGGAAAAQEEAEAEKDPQKRPENTLRPLPADTFKPSEEISEDFPVPFPVDI